MKDTKREKMKLNAEQQLGPLTIHGRRIKETRTERNTHYTIDAILAYGTLGNNNQISLDASLLQVFTAITAIPRLHVKFAMKTF